MDNHHFYRRKGTTKWIEYPPETPPPPPEQDTRISNSTYLLSLFQEKQGPGKPLHWSLFVARENRPGQVYQVTGDAEFMVYEPSEGVVALIEIEELCNVFVLGRGRWGWGTVGEEHRWE